MGITVFIFILFGQILSYISFPVPLMCHYIAKFQPDIRKYTSENEKA